MEYVALPVPLNRPRTMLQIITVENLARIKFGKIAKTAKIKYWRNLNLAIVYGKSYDVILINSGNLYWHIT